MQGNRRVSSWVRNNALGLAAIFIALTGTAFAAGLAKNSVTSKAIKKGAVKSSDVKDNALTGTDIDESSLVGVPNPSGPAGADFTGGYGSLELAPNAVGTPEIQDGSVTTAKLQDGAVTSSKLAAGAKPVAINVTIPEGVGPQTVASLGEIDIGIECADNAGNTRLRLTVINHGGLGFYHDFSARMDENGSQSSFHNFGALSTDSPLHIQTMFGNAIGSQGETVYEDAILQNPNRVVRLSIGLWANAFAQTCSFHGVADQAT